MKIFGIQKLSTVDFPKRPCTTLFTKGCNMRCLYCYNPELVYPRYYLPSHTEEEVLEMLLKRKKVIDAVCITGGEPTVHRDLPDFIRKLASHGFHIKLDTNGTNPIMLKKLLDEGLIDYVAMDLKTTFDEYTKLTKLTPALVEKVKKSIRILKESGIEYEFRTTVVHGHHTDDIIAGIAEMARGCPHYYLQHCQQEKAASKLIRQHEDFSADDLHHFAKIATEHFGDDVPVRGL